MNNAVCLARILLFSHALLLFSCDSKTDLAQEEIIIRKMLQQERKAHFDRNADLFIAEFADSMIAVNKGKVAVNSPGENKKRITSYFNSVRFIKWDDIADPVIRFSDDGSLAYAVIQKQVILTYPDSPIKPLYDTTNFAWTSIYRKQKGEWKIECNISTNQ